MNINKFPIYAVHCQYLKEARLSLELSAQSISKVLRKSPAWYGQIERGRITSLHRSDAISLLSILSGISPKNIEDGGYLENFINLPENYYNVSWYEDRQFDIYETYDIDTINRNLYFYLNKISEMIFLNTNHKERYVFLKSLETMYLNMNYSLEMTALLNSIELFNIALPEHKNNYTKKLISEYNILHALSFERDGYVLWEHEEIPANEILPKIDNIISEIIDAQDILRKLMLDNSNRENQITYNRTSGRIKNKVNNYYFSKHLPYALGNDDLETKIHDNYRILSELMSDMYRHKINTEKGINYTKVKLEGAVPLPNISFE